MSGIVEELFIANDSSGTSQVWFRNWSVTASLNLRSQLNADPESVKWGPTKDTFVIRTGTNPATQRYYFFQFARSVAHILGAGVVPAPVLVWTETPGTNTLVLASLSASLNQTVYKNTDPPNPEGRFFYSTIDFDSPAPFCTTTFNSGAVVAGATIIEKEITTGTKTQSVTLADILAIAGVTVQYGVNTARHLILYVVGTLPNVTGITTSIVTTVGTTACPPTGADTTTAGTGSVSSRSQTLLWVVNASTAGSSVLYRTALSSGTLTSKTHNNTGAGNIVTISRQVITGTGGCPSSTQCVDDSTLQVPPDATPVSFTGNVGQIEQNGTETQTDNMFDTSLPFVSGAVDPTYATSAVASQVQVVNGALYSYRIDYNVGTWAQTNTPWTYNVVRVYPITDTTPLAFLMVVTRTRTGLSEHALIYYNGFGYRKLLDFTAFTGSSSLKVLTANKSHAIWYITGTVYMSAFKLGINGKTVTVSTDVSGMQAQRFRLMYPEETLWAGGETANASPAGTFLDGWEADGTPTLVDDGTGFPVFLPLADFDTLAIVPAGISVPVLPTE